MFCPDEMVVGAVNDGWRWLEVPTLANEWSRWPPQPDGRALGPTGHMQQDRLGAVADPAGSPVLLTGGSLSYVGGQDRGAIQRLQIDRRHRQAPIIPDGGVRRGGLSRTARYDFPQHLVPDDSRDSSRSC